MLTKYQLELLIGNDYNIGKFYIALNAKDDNGINWLTFYGKKETASLEAINDLENQILEWGAADRAEQEEIVRAYVYEDDQVLLNNIKLEQDVISGVSNVVHQISNMAVDGELDSDHISENNLLTELMEVVADRRESVDSMDGMVLGTTFDMDREIKEHAKDMLTDLAFHRKALDESIKNKVMMDERQEWLKTTFKISEEESEEIIQKFGT